MTNWIYEDTVFRDNATACFSVGVLAKGEVVRRGEVSIIDSVAHGNLLCIGEDFQCCEKDHYYYSEFMAHAPMYHEGLGVKKVLVIGGGDGGTVAELIKYDSIELIDWVEINEDVVELSKEHLDFFPKKDDRINLKIEDGSEFIKTCGEYDIIIVDCYEPIGPARALYKQGFLKECADKCKTFIILGGYYVISDSLPRRIRHQLWQLYPSVSYHQVPTPTYCGGNTGFFLCSHHGDMKKNALPKTKWFCDYTLTATHNIAAKEMSVNKRQRSFKMFQGKNPQNFTQKELDYIYWCFQFDGEQSFDDYILSGHSLSYKVQGKKFWLRYLIGSSNTNVYEYAIKIAEEIGIKETVESYLGKDSYYGVGWDFKLNQIKFYKLSDLQSVPKNFEDLKDEDENYEHGILSVSFDRTTGELVERKIYYVGFMSTTMITDKRGKIIQHNCNSQRENWRDRVSDVGKNIIDEFEKNDISLDTIAFKNVYSYTLYFEE